MPLPAVTTLFSFLKNPTFLKWAAIGVVIGSLFIWGRMNSLEADAMSSKLQVANEQVLTLEQSLKAEKAKADQRKTDAESKQQALVELNQQKQSLQEQYQNVKSELDHILTTVIPNIETSEDLATAKEVVERSINVSYGCIESATKGESCEQ